MIGLSKLFHRRKPEVREDYTSAVVSHLMQAASSGGGSALGSVEVCARWWGAGLSSASVGPDSLPLRAVTPTILDSIGRSLCRSGESLHVIDVRNGRVVLTPAASWSIKGNPDPQSWQYSLTLSGPSSTMSTTLSAEALLHVRYSPHPSSPWRGRSPLQLALDTFKAASLLEGAAKEEFSFTQKQLIAPRRGAGDFAPIDSLSPDVITKIVDSFAQHVGAPTVVLPADVVPSRLGPEPPDSYALLRDRFESSILSACGIPPALVAASGTGTAMREGLRQILHGLLKPLGRILEEELREKLDQAASLDFSALRAGDITGSARAFGSLVNGGLSPKSAAKVVGLGEVEVSS